MREVVILVIGSLLLVGGLAWWSISAPNERSAGLRDTTEPITAPEIPVVEEVEETEEDYTIDKEIIDMNNPRATLQTNLGEITLELFTDVMPITTENFLTLAEDGFYDGVKFHRVIPGFMIQGGDPNTKGEDAATYGQGGPGYMIRDEFVSDPRLTNVRGTIAMANTGQPDSGGSQFFINVADNTGLDFDKEPLTSRHPVFGRVIEGMEVVAAIEQVPTGARDIPVDPVVIEAVRIERN